MSNWATRSPACGSTARMEPIGFSTGRLARASWCWGMASPKKQQKCPPEQVKQAKRMKARFEANPEAHTCEGETDGNDDEA